VEVLAYGGDDAADGDGDGVVAPGLWIGHLVGI